MNFNEWLQSRLNAHGAKIKVDGDWGRGSIQALNAFQIEKGLPLTGVADKRTVEALRQPPVPGSLSTSAPPAAGNMPPYMAEMHRKMGLHEVRDNAALSEWLRSWGRFLGNPKDLPWCFTGETEIMTEDGWQRFDSLTSERVWQADDDGRLSLTAYTPVVKEYDGKAYRINSSTVQATCDEGHRWWGRWDRSGKSEFKTLDRLTTDGVILPRMEATGAGVALSDDQVILAAAFMSDGFFHRGKMEFQVSRERKIVALTALSPQSVYVQKKAYGPRTKTPLTCIVFDVPSWMDAVFSDYKVLRRDFINNMSFEQCRQFIAAFAVFDGHTKPCGRVTLYTSDERTRDDLISIAAMAGFRPFTESGGASDLTKKDSWRIGFMPSSEKMSRIRPGEVTPIHHKGKMYCVQVPQGRIVLRGASLTPFVTGNCGDAVESCIAKTLPEEKLPSNPFFAQAWKDLGKDAGGPIVGSIGVIRWDAKSGHVGIVAGVEGDRVNLLGGNQSNAINISSFPRSKFIAFRWPLTFPIQHYAPLKGKAAEAGYGSTR